MRAFWSPSTATNFAFCFTSCDKEWHRVKLDGRKSALNPLPPPPIPLVVYSPDRSRAVVPVLVLLFVALWFILRGDLFYVLPCVILFLCFLVLLALRLPCFGKSELVLVLFGRLFDLYLFGFVCFLFLLVSGKGCGLWLWHSLDFSHTFFFFRILRNLPSHIRILVCRYSIILYIIDNFSIHFSTCLFFKIETG